MKKWLIILLIFLATPAIASAQVVINEFSSGDSDDWVELYSDEDVDISGWIIRDLKDSKISTIGSNTMIGPSTSKYIVVDAGNRLDKIGDTIRLLKKDDETEIDNIVYGEELCAPEIPQTIGRYPDGNSTMDRFASNTKGSSNDSAQLDPCPTPTPTPTNTPTPTQKPTSTNTPTPTKKPTSTPTKKPTKIPTPTEGEEEFVILDSTSDSDSEVLALEDDFGKPDEPEKQKDFLPTGLIVLGVLFVGVASVPLFKSLFVRYFKKNG